MDLEGKDIHRSRGTEKEKVQKVQVYTIYIDLGSRETTGRCTQNNIAT